MCKPCKRFQRRTNKRNKQKKNTFPTVNVTFEKKKMKFCDFNCLNCYSYGSKNEILIERKINLLKQQRAVSMM